MTDELTFRRIISSGVTYVVLEELPVEDRIFLALLPEATFDATLAALEAGEVPATEPLWVEQAGMTTLPVDEATLAALDTFVRERAAVVLTEMASRA
jgi:hypothetical protein